MNWYKKAQADDYFGEDEISSVEDIMEEMEIKRTRQKRIQLKRELFKAVSRIVRSLTGGMDENIDVMYEHVSEWASLQFSGLGNQKAIDDIEDVIKKLWDHPSTSLAACGVPGTIACWGIISGLLGMGMKQFKNDIGSDVRLVLIELVSENVIETHVQAKQALTLATEIMLEGHSYQEAKQVIKSKIQ